MTKQDKIISSLSIMFGGGFQANEPLKSKGLPLNFFAAFLNVNSDNIEEINVYCNLYGLILYGKNALSEFRAEQEKIRSFVTKIKGKKISNDDLNYIVDKLPVKKWKLFTGRDVHEINENIEGKEKDYYEYSLEPIKRNRKESAYKSLVNIPTNPFSLLYEELDILIKDKNRAKTCDNCGLFYVPNKRSPKQRFCDDGCNDKYKKRLKYRKDKSA